MVTPLVNRSVDDVLVSQTKFASSFLQVVDVMNLCFIHALLYKTPNTLNLRHVMTLVHFYEAMTHDTSDAIFFGNILVFLTFTR